MDERNCENCAREDCAFIPPAGEVKCEYWHSDTHAVNRWIPCSERLPEREKDVLVYYPRWHDDMFSQSGIVVAQLMYDGLTWDICGEFNPGLHAISHWMPLPEPPEKEDET